MVICACVCGNRSQWLDYTPCLRKAFVVDSVFVSTPSCLVCKDRSSEDSDFDVKMTDV